MTDHDLNDELNPQHELASAYLDGVASPTERAQVEASPELQALVASFTAVRAELADVAPVASSSRDAAFAAAFAEFDAPAFEPAAAGAAIIPLSSNRRWTRPVLSVAAAVLLVGAIGVAAKGGLSGNDSESSSMDTSAKVASADEAATEAQMTAESIAWASASTIGSIDSSAETALVIDTPEQLLALSSTTMADTVAGSPETTAAASENTTSAETLPLPTPMEVTSARTALGCLTAQQEFLADIQYQGAFAIAARDTVTGMTSAITDDCTVLATVGP